MGKNPKPNKVALHRSLSSTVLVGVPKSSLSVGAQLAMSVRLWRHWVFDTATSVLGSYRLDSTCPMVNMAYPPSYALEHCSRVKQHWTVFTWRELAHTDTLVDYHWYRHPKSELSGRFQVWTWSHIWTMPWLSFRERLQLKFQGHKKYGTKSETEKQTGNINKV